MEDKLKVPTEQSNKNDQRLYLLTLEVAPMSVGKTYNPLPSHLTLMHRFWSELPPEELAQAVRPVFQHTQPLQLLFGHTELHGPQKARVNIVELTNDLQKLHMQLFDLLNTLRVTYTAPQWVGNGFGPHVTEREGVEFIAGHRQMTRGAYLIEVKIRGTEHLRFIRAKFDLATERM